MLNLIINKKRRELWRKGGVFFCN